MNLDPSFLRAALVGYQNQLAQIEQAMADLRRRIKKAPGGGTGTAPAQRTKRTMSAAARRRIAAAQKKRWAAYKKAKSAKG